MSDVDALVAAAADACRDPSATPAERAQMLMELAIGLQRRPKTPAHLAAAIRLYDDALAQCPGSEPLLAARIEARRATALQALPEEGVQARKNIDRLLRKLITLTEWL